MVSTTYPTPTTHTTRTTLTTLTTHTTHSTVTGTLTGTITPLTGIEGTPLKGARRARLSIHFNTPRMRRWLLVQLVTMPAQSEPDEVTALLALRQARPARPTLGQLLDHYQMERFTRLCNPV